MSVPDIDAEAIGLLIQQGFILGAAIGVIFGSLTWVLLNPGTPPILPLVLMGVVGLLTGALIEGSAFLSVLSTDFAFMSSRGGPFNTLVAVMGWIFGGLAIGAAIGNLSRAVVGAIVGVVMGTAAGMIMISFQNDIAFPAESSVGMVILAVITMIFVFLASLGQGTANK